MNKRIYSIDVLKFLCAILIIFHHYQGQFDVTFPSMNFAGGIFYFGYLVELFFIISGYLACSGMERIPEQEDFGTFMQIRCIRLLPLNMFAAALHCISIQLIYGSFHIWGFLVTSLGLYALGGDFAIYNVNPPSWYISALLLCYIWFYALVYWGKRIAREKEPLPPYWLFAIVVLIGLVGQVFGYSYPFLNTYTSRGYCAFFVGVLLKFFTEKHGVSSKMAWGALLICLVTGCLFCFSYSHIAYGINYLLTFITYPALILLCDSKLSHSLFRFPWLRILGEVSFGMYLLHTPIFHFLRYINDRYALALPTTSRAFMLLCTAGVIAIAFVVLFFVEKPITRLLSRKKAVQ